MLIRNIGDEVRVFIAGATGVLGRRIVTWLKDAGNEVLCLVRSSENERVISSLGGQPRRGDLFDADSLSRAAEGSEVVIRAATSIPPGIRWRPRDWATNDRIRRAGTRALVECAAKIRAKLYLQESVVWVAQPPDGSFFDESSPVHPRLWFGSAIDAESIAREGGDRGGFDVVTLRFGAFYCADSGQTRFMGQSLVERKLPIPGRGDAVWSNIHVDDAAAATTAAVGAMRSGLWHVIDDRPTSMADMFRVFAQVLDAPEPRSIPSWLAKLFIGRSTLSFLTSSTRTSNSKIRKDLGWVPTHPSFEQGIRQVVRAWQEEGFPPRQGSVGRKRTEGV